MTKEKPQKYELYLLLKPSVIETDIDNLEDKVKQEIEKAGFKVSEATKFVKKELAHPMDKNSHAYAATFLFEGDPGNVGQLETELKATEVPVLRYMVTKPAPEEEIVRREVAPKEEHEKPQEQKESREEDDDKEKDEVEETPESPEDSAGKDSDEDRVTIEDIDKRLDEIMDNL